MSILRILIWNLADSKSSLAEVLDQLPEPREGDEWIANEPQERFGRCPPRTSSRTSLH